MKINTQMISDLHINMLNTVLAILTNDMRERKALLKTVDEHGLPLIRAAVELFHLHKFHFVENRYKNADDGRVSEDDDGSCQQRAESPRFDRRQSILRERSVTKVSDIEGEKARSSTARGREGLAPTGWDPNKHPGTRGSG